MPNATEAVGAARESQNGQDAMFGYNIVEAAPAYSSVIGLVSGFALTAVVLVFTIAATNHNLSASQQVDLGFATTLFALGFVGCLLCAFAFASMSGEPKSEGAFTYAMLVGSGLSVCIVAVLGGFVALSRAFLPDSSIVFLIVCTALASAAPAFVWIPHWDIVQNFGPSEDLGRLSSKHEAGRLVISLSVLGVIAAFGGLTFQLSGILSTPQQWEYLVLSFVGLAFTLTMMFSGLWISVLSDHRARLTVRTTWVVAIIQSITIFLMIALLP